MESLVTIFWTSGSPEYRPSVACWEVIACLDSWFVSPFYFLIESKLLQYKYIETHMKHLMISGGMEENASGKNGFFAANNGSGIGVDVWCSCLCSFLEKDRITSRCLSATANAWIMVYTRLSALYIVVDPTYCFLTRYHRKENLLIVIDFFLQ